MQLFEANQKVCWQSTDVKVEEFFPHIINYMLDVITIILCYILGHSFSARYVHMPILYYSMLSCHITTGLPSPSWEDLQTTYQSNIGIRVGK